MADLIIIYDKDREIAAYVNAETQQGWGPAMIGEGANEALAAFVAATPFDITLLTSQDAADAFAGFLDGIRAGVAETPAQAPESPLEPSDGEGVAEGEPPLYGSEDAGEPAPEPGAADTDEPPAPPSPVQIVDCFNCGGTGHIEFGDESPAQVCNMCQGRGKIAQAA